MDNNTLLNFPINDNFEIHEKKVLQCLLDKQESLFRHLQYLAQEILKDREINSNDIPNLILFVKDLYAFICNIREELNMEIHFIQFMLPTFVKKLVKYLAKSWKEDQMVVLENIVDASVLLLFYATDMVITKKCFSFCF